MKAIMSILVIIIMLFLGGCSFNSPILQQKINKDDFTNLESLLKKGENPNTTNHNGYSLLYEAAYVGNLDAAKLLIKYGADVDLAADSDSCSRTPLIEALKYRHLNVALLLAQNGADLTQEDSCFERTPLHWFAYEGFYSKDENIAKQLIKFMKKKGVDFNQRDRSDDIPLELAVTTHGVQNKEKVVELLLQGGANPTIQTSDSEPPILSALYYSPKISLSFIQRGYTLRAAGYYKHYLCFKKSCRSIEGSGGSTERTINFMMFNFPKEALYIYKAYKGDIHQLDHINQANKRKMAEFVKNSIGDKIPKRFIEYFYEQNLLTLNSKDFKYFPQLISLAKTPKDFKKIARFVKPSDAIAQHNEKLYRYMCNNLNRCISDNDLKEIIDNNQVEKLKAFIHAGFDIKKHYKNLYYKQHQNLSFLEYIVYATTNNLNLNFRQFLISAKNIIDTNELLKLSYSKNNMRLAEFLLGANLTKFTSIDDFIQRRKISLSKLLPNVKNWTFDSWDGKLDKDFHPKGKGTIILQRGLGGGYLAHYAQLNIDANVKNNKIIGKGKVEAFIVKQVALLGYDQTNLYKTKYKYFSNISELNKIIDQTDRLVEIYQEDEEKWQEMRRKDYQNRNKVNCSTMYKQCMSYCDKKSSKGFFSDKSSCQTACISGKNSCKNGEYSLGKITSCRGICKGVNASNGSFLGWGASSFDKCVDSCTDRIGR